MFFLRATLDVAMATDDKDESLRSVDAQNISVGVATGPESTNIENGNIENGNIENGNIENGNNENGSELSQKVCG